MSVYDSRVGYYSNRSCSNRNEMKMSKTVLVVIPLPSVCQWFLVKLYCAQYQLQVNKKLIELSCVA